MSQLELFHDTPYALRVSIEDAVRIFWDSYWCHLPFGKKSKSIRYMLVSFFRGHYLDSISKSDVERFRRHLKGMGYSESTINKAHMTLSRIYTKWGEYKEGRFLNGTDVSRVVLPLKNPASLVPRVNERKFARGLEITAERKKILCQFADEDLYEIIDGLWWTTLRLGDFFAITSKNVNVRQMTITGTQSKSITTRNPGGLPYMVDIPIERLKVILRRMDNTKPGTPLFRRKNMQKRWNAVRLMASRIDPELAKAQMRDLRGGATSHLLDHGTDLETVRKNGGWSTTEMIPFYDKRSNAPLREAKRKLVEA